jgi:type IV pilus assembly protein PilA
MKSNEEGFTLIEILVVILIIGVLSAIAIPVFLNQRKTANDSAVESDVKNIATILQTLPPDSLQFSKQSIVGSTGVTRLVYISKGEVKTEDVPTSSGMWWSITGNSNSYCVLAYHANGNKYTQTNPLTYDSTAGGLGKTGTACNPQAVGGTGDVYVAGNFVEDPTLANANIAAPVVGNFNRIFSYYSFPFKSASMATPVGNKVITGTTNSTSVPQGIIFFQPANEKAVPVSKAGEVYTVSVYVKSDAGTKISVGPRISDIGTGYNREVDATFTATGGWDRFNYTSTTVTSDIGSYVNVQARLSFAATNKVLYFAGPQVEQGSTMTAFKGN